MGRELVDGTTAAGPMKYLMTLSLSLGVTIIAEGVVHSHWWVTGVGAFMIGLYTSYVGRNDL
jgi:hypothetical protein